jgi:hypothetical protein
VGLGVFCRLKAERSDWSVGIGRFRNSVEGHSNYGSAAYQPWRFKVVRLGGFAGVINGYSYRNGGYFPYAGALASIPVPFGEIHVVGIPNTPHTPATVEFSVAIRF